MNNDQLKLIETTERYIIFKCSIKGQFLQKSQLKSQNLVKSMLKPNELQIRNNRTKKLLQFQFNEEKDPVEEDRASDYSDHKSTFSCKHILIKYNQLEGILIDSCQKIKQKLVTKDSRSPKSEELSIQQEKESNNSRDEGIIEEDEDEIYYNEEQIDNLQLEEAQCSVNETDRMHDDDDNISDTSQEDFHKKKKKISRLSSIKNQGEEESNQLSSSQE